MVFWVQKECLYTLIHWDTWGLIQLQPTNHHNHQKQNQICSISIIKYNDMGLSYFHFFQRMFQHYLHLSSWSHTNPCLFVTPSNVSPQVLMWCYLSIISKATFQTNSYLKSYFYLFEQCRLEPTIYFVRTKEQGSNTTRSGWRRVNEATQAKMMYA